jgi:hypothetical protein
LIDIKGALISVLTTIKEKPYSFSIQVEPPNGKVFYISSDFREEAEEWRLAVHEAANRHKVTRKVIPRSSARDSRLEYNSPEQQFGRKSFGGPLRSPDQLFNSNRPPQNNEEALFE